MIEKRDRLDAQAVITMVVLCGFWGMNQTAIKFATVGISPFTQGGLRCAGAAVLIWIWARLRGIPLFVNDGTVGLSLIAILLFAVQTAFLYFALIYTNASRAVLILYSSPFFLSLGAHIFVPTERLKPTHMAGLVCAFLGIVTVFIDGLRLPTYRELWGDFLALLSTVTWSAGTLMYKASRLSQIGADRVMFYQMGGTAAVILPIAWLIGEPGIFATSVTIWGGLLYQIAIVGFASYLIWCRLIQTFPMVTLSAFTFLTPLFGLLAGHFILHEPISILLVAALVLVALGIYLVNRPTKATEVKP